jgi:hypothetical protein
VAPIQTPAQLQEGDRRGERDGSLRQREPEEVPDHHREPLHEKRRDADAAISCDLSPSSARKTTERLTSTVVSMGDDLSTRRRRADR